MRIKLPYGKKWIEAGLPDNAVVLEPVFEKGLEDEREKAFDAFRHPIGSPPLKEIAKKGDRVAIVISDITRPTPNHKIVPWIVEELNHLPRDNFVIVNGTGSHRANSDGELVEMVGQEVFETIRIVNHNAFIKEDLTYVGKSSSGAEVFLNRAYCDADVRIAVGFIEPHFFAGFSGGPKSVMPGVAGIDTIMHFHSAELIGHPQSTWGIIENNPVQKEATEIALMCRPHFTVNVTLNRDKEITDIFAGDVIDAHRAGAAYVKKNAMVACRDPFDIVITTNSGYPLDQNLYQAVKGMSAAQQVVKKGGAVICAAECSEGLPDHGNFKKILRMRETPEERLEMINAPGFSMFDQWEAQKLSLIQLWARIYLLSSLPQDEVLGAALHPVETIEGTLAHLTAEAGGKPGIAVMPQGPMSIPYIEAG